MMQLKRTSTLTGINHFREIDITLNDLLNWEASGKHIQDYFPHLSDDDREFIISGITPEEWEVAFGDEDQDEEELPEHLQELLNSGFNVDITLEKPK